MYYKFIEETLQDFLVKVNASPFTLEELEEIERDKSPESRIRYQVTKVKWYARVYATLLLDALHTIPYALLGGPARYDRDWFEQLRSVVPQQIFDDVTKTVQEKPAREFIRESYADIWRKIKNAPLIASYVLNISGYYLVQNIIGPMIYWPLRIFQRPICWVIRNTRGGV